jgi:hypothetical protein
MQCVAVVALPTHVSVATTVDPAAAEHVGEGCAKGAQPASKPGQTTQRSAGRGCRPRVPGTGCRCSYRGSVLSVYISRLSHVRRRHLALDVVKRIGAVAP